MVGVSVIVPVYNVEDYLRECLDSILDQTFDDFEIICVDDGSTDGSSKILEEYQKNDSRVKVITQTNHGLGHARNVAMDNSNGEYICFIDSDDYFTPTTLNDVYNISKDNNIDILMFKLLNFEDKTGQTSSMRYFDMPFLKEFGEKSFNYRDVEDNVLSISVTAPGKLFRRDFINQLRFPENIIFEDTPFIVEALFMAERILFVDEYYYMRRVRTDSITNSNFSHFSDCIEIFNMVNNIAKKYGYYDNHKELMFSRKYLNISRRFLEVNEADKKDFFEKIKRDIDKSNNSNINLNQVKPKARYIYTSACECDNHYDFENKLKNYSTKKPKKSFLSKIFSFIKK